MSDAANRVRDGDFAASHLDEEAVTSEIREVNIGFNRMAQKLAKLEQDRAVMLAGISHDLRTPLARLRLETEMSVNDEVAREHMVADIVQLDATIDKFLDYARPDHVTLTPVNLHAVISSCVYAVQDHRELQITMQVPEDLNVLADEVELARVISNLLENARRYGKTPDTASTRVEIAAKAREDWVLIKLRDHGTGVPPEQLANLTKPFFRGDAARTAAAGAGLGLSIVDKTVQRMGGIFALANSTSGGLVAHIQLQRASDQPPGHRSPSNACSAHRSSATCPEKGVTPPVAAAPALFSLRGREGGRCCTAAAWDAALPDRAVAASEQQATARASMARHWPTGPRRSAVLAFTFTWSTCRPKAPAMRSRMAGMWAARRGACATTVLSMLPICQPCARTRRAASCNSTTESAPRNCASVSGKCVPMSPSAAAPSSASVMACSSTSASEWPSRPSVWGISTPPMTSRRPGTSACMSQPSPILKFMLFCSLAMSKNGFPRRAPPAARAAKTLQRGAVPALRQHGLGQQKSSG